jgi:hypothetical protein
MAKKEERREEIQRRIFSWENKKIEPFLLHRHAKNKLSLVIALKNQSLAQKSSPADSNI